MRYRKLFIILAVLILGGLLAFQVSIAGKGQGKGKGPKASAPVPQTGQTVCYDTNGAVIDPCDGTGHDGDYQVGVPYPIPRFTINDDGTVRDNMTGLIWLRDANCSGDFLGRTWTEALNDCNTLADGDCELTDGSSPGDWRLPNVRELYSLVHYAMSRPAIPNTDGTAKWTTDGEPFFNVVNGWHWTSTSGEEVHTNAWVVGTTNANVSNVDKNLFRAVWPVRGGN